MLINEFIANLSPVIIIQEVILSNTINNINNFLHLDHPVHLLLHFRPDHRFLPELQHQPVRTLDFVSPLTGNLAIWSGSTTLTVLVDFSSKNFLSTITMSGK